MIEFLALTVIFVVFLWAFYELEHVGFTAGITFLLYWAWFYSKVDLQYIQSHPVESGMFIGAYLFLGGLWSVYAWYKYMQREAPKHSIVTSALLLPPWANPSENKGKFYMWILGWPFDLLIRLIKDPLDFIITYLSGVYVNISKKALGLQ